MNDSFECFFQETTKPGFSFLNMQVARNILAALKVMHSSGMVHRDLKPANIMRCTSSPPEIASNSFREHEGSPFRRLSSSNFPTFGRTTSSKSVGSVKINKEYARRGPLLSAKNAGRQQLQYVYKLIDFGTAVGIDDTIAGEEMMTMVSSREMGAGTPPYMSPEMFKEPQKAG